MFLVHFMCRSAGDGRAPGGSDERGERALWDPPGVSVSVSAGLMETIENSTGCFRSLWTGAFLPELLASLWISKHKGLLYPIHLDPPLPVCVHLWAHTEAKAQTHTLLGFLSEGLSFAPVYLFYFLFTPSIHTSGFNSPKTAWVNWRGKISSGFSLSLCLSFLLSISVSLSLKDSSGSHDLCMRLRHDSSWHGERRCPLSSALLASKRFPEVWRKGFQVLLDS